jgi:murein DD-endopeptidase MepM/ murein hydrolase activator NlpD
LLILQAGFALKQFILTYCMRPIDKFLHLASGSRDLFRTSRKSRILAAGAAFFALCAFGAMGVAPLAPDAADLPVKKITQELDLPKLQDQIAALEATEQHFVSEEQVQRGDTLGAMLMRLGVDDKDALEFIRSDKTARGVLQVRAGHSWRAQTNEDGELDWLQAVVSDAGANKPARTITISRDASGHFNAADSDAKLEKRLEMRSAEIRSSLFAATDAAEIPDAVASQLVEMFATNIDFASDLRRGDYFNVVYETFWQNGEMVKTGRVLAGEFHNAGKLYQSVWYEDGAHEGSYYSMDGQSLKKAFLKSPIAFTRISSGFSMRIHPISGQWKQHTGVDFAAAMGTPIHAAADGVVDFSGVQNGYGNVVVVKHWSGYSTAYAHMSRFEPGVRKGSHVSQGDVIGYVGATGWATGPHLHYEFRVNNVARDPMSVNVPNAAPLAAGELNKFKGVAADMAHRFALLRPIRPAEVVKVVASR